MPVATADLIAAWPDVKDSCARFFGTCLRAARPDLKSDARVLEIGCCEYDWLTPAAAAWPEMTVTGIDWRPRKRIPPAGRALQGDVMTHDFAPASFDWIVSISAIEHIGLGHYSHDPVREDGDTVTLARAWEWLAPGGWLYFDVPYNPARYEVVRTSHRIYDDAAVEARLAQGLPWRRHFLGIAGLHDTHQLIAPRPMKGGEHFDYIGFWWQKPGA